jgi:zona occludens toxin (predicted ATPase)
MIYLYSGTPGSGKSLHVAQKLYYWIKNGKPAICNFPLNLDRIRCKQKNFHYWDNNQINPQDLIKFSQDFFGTKKSVKEGSILLVIDECQLMFNARDWSKNGRSDWLSFFTLHRHFGYDIILIAQFDRMIDRQIRSLIEYEYIHRKLSNYGFKGVLLSLCMGSRKMFVSVKVWYPMKEKVGQEFYRCRRKYFRLYDTFLLLGSPN